jgi:poly-beta-1,6-N-acetyl-D-glucosamine synthase
MPFNSRYVLISPCRNEAAFMRRTLESVVGQSVTPRKWVIVDDGSTDETPAVLKEYASKYEWISIVTRADRGHRAVGPGVVDAFYSGYETIDRGEYDFVCKLDLDLFLPPRYFEILIHRMNADPRIATCSGKSYIQENGHLVNERHGDDTSLGMTKFYRMDRFQAIGGFVREVMWDGIDCHLCRMHGWIACSWDDPDLRFVHLRPMGSSQQSIYTGRMRHGYGQYFMGTGFPYLALSALSRVNQKPYVFGSLAILWGWIRSAALRKPRYENLDFRRFLRRYQKRALIVGKRRAIADLTRDSPLASAAERPDRS